jgi:hypothetical protein
MRGFVLSLGALALQQVNAWSYPDCELDNCYRNLIDEAYAEEAKAFCPGYIAATTTAASAIPTNFANCGGDYKAVSSACSCIAYTLTHTSSASVSTKAPVSSSTSTTTSSICEETTSSSVSSKAPIYTTSTVYTTNVYTITSCKPEVTNCPSKPHVTTEVIPLYTTVCPVEETKTYPTLTTSTKSYGTPVPTKAATTSGLPVTAGVGKMGSSFGAAAAAGVLAAAALL